MIRAVEAKISRKTKRPAYEERTSQPPPNWQCGAISGSRAPMSRTASFTTSVVTENSSKKRPTRIGGPLSAGFWPTRRPKRSGQIPNDPTADRTILDQGPSIAVMSPASRRAALGGRLVLGAPFRARAPHIVKLRTIGVTDVCDQDVCEQVAPLRHESVEARTKRWR